MITENDVSIPQTAKRAVLIRSTKEARESALYFRRVRPIEGTERLNDLRCVSRTYSIDEAINEAQRCLKCYEAPCVSSCRTQLDVSHAHNALQEGDFYLAAKLILTTNPLAWSCGYLCATSSSCRGSCVLADSHLGAIHIPELHKAILEVFSRTKLPIFRPILSWQQQNKYHCTPIALIGSGPASLSCATYLARIGYNNIHIFERHLFPGGTPAAEIAEFRIPHRVTLEEIRFIEDLGVKFHCGVELGRDIHLKTLFDVDRFLDETYSNQMCNNYNSTRQKSEITQSFDQTRNEQKTDWPTKFGAIFVGMGNPESVIPSVFRNAQNCINVFTSKSFLGAFCASTKECLWEWSERHGLPRKIPPFPRLHGRVLVVGAGDVAADTAQSAFRCGAEQVSLVVRRGVSDMRMNEDELTNILRDKVEILGCHAPREVIVEEQEVDSEEVNENGFDFKFENGFNVNDRENSSSKKIKVKKAVALVCDLMIKKKVAKEIRKKVKKMKRADDSSSDNSSADNQSKNKESGNNSIKVKEEEEEEVISTVVEWEYVKDNNQTRTLYFDYLITALGSQLPVGSSFSVSAKTSVSTSSASSSSSSSSFSSSSSDINSLPFLPPPPLSASQTKYLTTTSQPPQQQQDGSSKDANITTTTISVQSARTNKDSRSSSIPSSSSSSSSNINYINNNNNNISSSSSSNFIIASSDSPLHPLPLSAATRSLCVHPITLETPLLNIWCGGDCAHSSSVVEAVNDGKIAAWSIHRRLSGEDGVKDKMARERRVRRAESEESEEREGNNLHRSEGNVKKDDEKEKEIEEDISSSTLMAPSVYSSFLSTISSSSSIPQPPSLPPLTTAVDLVDLSVPPSFPPSDTSSASSLAQSKSTSMSSELIQSSISRFSQPNSKPSSSLPFSTFSIFPFSLPHPVGIAASQSTDSAIRIKKAFQNGYAFVVTKTVAIPFNIELGERKENNSKECSCSSDENKSSLEDSISSSSSSSLQHQPSSSSNASSAHHNHCSSIDRTSFSLTRLPIPRVGGGRRSVHQPTSSAGSSGSSSMAAFAFLDEKGEKDVGYWQKELPKLKKEWKNRAVVVSLAVSGKAEVENVVLDYVKEMEKDSSKRSNSTDEKEVIVKSCSHLALSPLDGEIVRSDYAFSSSSSSSSDVSFCTLSKSSVSSFLRHQRFIHSEWLHTWVDAGQKLQDAGADGVEIVIPNHFEIFVDEKKRNTVEIDSVEQGKEYKKKIVRLCPCCFGEGSCDYSSPSSFPDESPFSPLSSSPSADWLSGLCNSEAFNESPSFLSNSSSFSFCPFCIHSLLSALSSALSIPLFVKLSNHTTDSLNLLSAIVASLNTRRVLAIDNALKGIKPSEQEFPMSNKFKTDTAQIMIGASNDLKQGSSLVSVTSRIDSFLSASSPLSHLPSLICLVAVSPIAGILQSNAQTGHSLLPLIKTSDSKSASSENETNSYPKVNLTLPKDNNSHPPDVTVKEPEAILSNGKHNGSFRLLQDDPITTYSAIDGTSLYPFALSAVTNISKRFNDKAIRSQNWNSNGLSGSSSSPFSIYLNMLPNKDHFPLVPLIFSGGIQNGSDVFSALQHGASLVVASSLLFAKGFEMSLQPILTGLKWFVMEESMRHTVRNFVEFEREKEANEKNKKKIDELNSSSSSSFSVAASTFSSSKEDYLPSDESQNTLPSLSFVPPFTFWSHHPFPPMLSTRLTPDTSFGPFKERKISSDIEEIVSAPLPVCDGLNVHFDYCGNADENNEYGCFCPKDEKRRDSSRLSSHVVKIKHTSWSERDPEAVQEEKDGTKWMQKWDKSRKMQSNCQMCSSSLKKIEESNPLSFLIGSKIDSVEPISSLMDHSDSSFSSHSMSGCNSSSISSQGTIRLMSSISLTHCIRCGLCHIACFDSGYFSIAFDRALRIPIVSPTCVGCGLCEAICPVNCITMRDREVVLKEMKEEKVKQQERQQSERDTQKTSRRYILDSSKVLTSFKENATGIETNIKSSEDIQKIDWVPDRFKQVPMHPRSIDSHTCQSPVEPQNSLSGSGLS